MGIDNFEDVKLPKVPSSTEIKLGEVLGETRQTVGEIQDFTWKEEYSVGVPELDRQHRKFMNQINDLRQIKDNDRKKIDIIISNLSNYVFIHSQQEEIFLKKIGYPDLKRHKEGHRLFSDRLDEVDRIFTSAKTMVNTSEIYDLLVKWWHQHIIICDGRYRTYIQENNIDAKSIDLS